MVQDAEDGHPSPARHLHGDGIDEAGNGPDHAPSARSEPIVWIAERDVVI